MKNILTILAAIIAVVMPACAQKLKESQVPPVAVTAFKNQYPNTQAKWEKEDGNYEVNFKSNGKVMSCVIDKNGTVLETETDIAVSELPASAQTYVKEHYAGAKAKGAAKILKYGGEINFEAEVKGKALVFDTNGKFIKEEKD